MIYHTKKCKKIIKHDIHLSKHIQTTIYHCVLLRNLFVLKPILFLIIFFYLLLIVCTKTTTLHKTFCLFVRFKNTYNKCTSEMSIQNISGHQINTPHIHNNCHFPFKGSRIIQPVKTKRTSQPQQNL